AVVTAPHPKNISCPGEDVAVCKLPDVAIEAASASPASCFPQPVVTFRPGELLHMGEGPTPANAPVTATKPTDPAIAAVELELKNAQNALKKAKDAHNNLRDSIECPVTEEDAHRLYLAGEVINSAQEKVWQTERDLYEAKKPLSETMKK